MAFKKTPFSLSPNPTLLCLTENLNALFARCAHVIEHRQGLKVIVGGVGRGKSTVMRYLYADYDAREETTVAMIETPEYASPHALLRAICDELGLELKRSQAEQLKVFKAFGGREDRDGRTTVILIDEAQKLTTKMLELMRALLNYETADHKLVQIVLAGQPELNSKLQLERNKAVRSRIIATSKLETLSREEMEEMIQHRCQRSSIRKMPFTPRALDRVHELSEGVPREALRLCQIAYELMGRSGARTIDVDLIETVAEDGDLRDADAA